MKKVLVLMAGLLLIGANLYAGNGDLIVNGKVGIGTTIPGFKLTTDITANDDGIRLENGSVSNNALVAMTRDGGNNRGNLAVYNANSITSIIRGLGNTSFNGGNVGIGTSTPQAKLDINYGNAGTPATVRIDARLNSTGPGLKILGSTRSYSESLVEVDNYLGNPNFVILSSGSVGIGMPNPQYTLDITGTAHLGYGVWQTSDIRFKKELLPIDSALDKILKLGGVSFEWIKDKTNNEDAPTDSTNADDNLNRKYEKDKIHPEDGRHYGVIAQEIEKVLPEVVREDNEGNKAVAYTEIIPILIEAMKEQQKQITDQQKKIDALEKKVAQLK